LLALPEFAVPGAEGSVAWQAHVGGFVAGLLGFAAFDPARPSPTGTEAGTGSGDEQASRDETSMLQ
jgi:membrane associated rhomboid family serine protease